MKKFIQEDPLDLFDKQYALMSEDVQTLLDNTSYSYLFFKACNYLKSDPEKYRKDDFFGQPTSTNKEELLIIENGCKQVLECKGLSEATPFSEIGITGFYQLMSLFHYESIKKKTRYGFVLNEQRGILDAITFQHTVDQNELTLYNFVRS